MKENTIKQFLTEELDKNIDELFVKIHKKAKTVSGDITPDQDFRLQVLKEEIVILMTNQVVSNQKV